MLQLEDSEIRNICKEKLEALEHWLRRLIDEMLSKAYGDFFTYEDSNGNRLLKKTLSDSINERLKKEPDRYSRKIDAILLDDAIDIICNPKLFNDYFKDPLAQAFPDGQSCARTFMKRLSDPRNRLAHANPISLRQFEQVTCYTGDIIESIKCYYSNRNMSEEYNVPLILKVIDSFGNTLHRDQFQKVYDGGIFKNLAEEPKYYLRSGDVLTIEVEVDPSFSEDEYEISWFASNGFGNPIQNGRKAVIELTDNQVAIQYSVQCHVKSKKTWHRLSLGVDDFLMYVIRVLPPV